MTRYLDQISKIKQSQDKNFISIKLNDKMVFLRPVDDSKETVRLITEWRNKNSEAFLSKFHATENRTKEWIQNDIIKKNSRILFLIILENQKIGHIGVHRYDEKNNTADIDSVLRAVRGSYPKLMEKVLNSMFDWMFNDLKLSTIRLRVFSDNYKAINLYERAGMLTVKSVPLKRTITSDGWVWNEVKKEEINKFPERFLNIMEITKDLLKKLMK